MANNNIALETAKIANKVLQTFVDSLKCLNYVSKDISAEELSETKTVKIIKPTSDFISLAFDPSVGAQIQGVTSNIMEVTVDQWRHVAFKMTDKEVLEISAGGLLSAKFQDGMNAHALEINTRFYNLYKKVYQFSGTGTANAFKSDDVRNASRVLSKSLVTGSKVSIVGSDAFYDIIGETAKYMNTGATLANQAFVNNAIPSVHGAPMIEETLLNNYVHIAGTASAGAVTVAGAHVAGVTSIDLNTVGATDTFNEGDLIEISGNQYVISADTDAVSNVATVSISPALKVDLVDDEAVTAIGDHNVNLMFTPDLAIFVMRSFGSADAKLGLTGGSSAINKVITDPKTGVPLRFRIYKDENKSTWIFSMDILYTIDLIDARYACRMLNS